MRTVSTPDHFAARLSLSTRNAGLAQQMADLLRDLGFQIEQVSPRGVSFAGPGRLFEAVFHSRIHPFEGGFTFEAAPQLPDAMTSAGATVYLPTRPEFFA